MDILEHARSVQADKNRAIEAETRRRRLLAGPALKQATTLTQATRKLPAGRDERTGRVPTGAS
jgi:hypothetical protein